MAVPPYMSDKLEDHYAKTSAVGRHSSQSKSNRETEALDEYKASAPTQGNWVLSSSRSGISANTGAGHPAPHAHDNKSKAYEDSMYKVVFHLDFSALKHQKEITAHVSNLDGTESVLYSESMIFLNGNKLEGLSQDRSVLFEKIKNVADYSLRVREEPLMVAFNFDFA